MDNEKLILENMPLARHIAKRLFGKYLDNRQYADISLDDLEQQGMLGLVQAAAAFDPNRGIKFSSFACLRIMGTILEFIQRSERLNLTIPPLQREDMDVYSIEDRRIPPEPLSQMCEALSPTQTAIVILRYQHSMPFSAIAKVIGLCSTEIQNRHNAALETLRKDYGN